MMLRKDFDLQCLDAIAVGVQSYVVFCTVENPSV